LTTSRFIVGSTMPNLSFGERIAQGAWRVAPKRLLSGMIGWGAKRRLPKRLQISLLRCYAKAYGLNSAEAEHPIEHYPSLQAFFTRRLAPGSRNAPTDEHSLVAPSDGTICEAGLATAGKLLEAKGSVFTLQTLLADDALAARLIGGPYVVIYLSPRDYHRVHFPASGKVVAWSHIPGKLFPVGSRSVRREPGLFARNERFVTVVDSPLGRYAVVMVAAVGVGHITASYDVEVATHGKKFAKSATRHKSFDPPIPIKCGQELGVFNLGSTTITIFEPGRIELDELVSDAQIEMGTPVGRIISG
jgi:phosphatidylserine decarboxylase